MTPGNVNAVRRLVFDALDTDDQNALYQTATKIIAQLDPDD